MSRKYNHQNRFQMRLVDTEISRYVDGDNHIIIGEGIPLFEVYMTEYHPVKEANHITMGDDTGFVITVKDNIPDDDVIIERLKELRELPDDYLKYIDITETGGRMPNVKAEWIVKFAKVITSICIYMKINLKCVSRIGMVKHISVYDYETDRKFECK